MTHKKVILFAARLSHTVLIMSQSILHETKLDLAVDTAPETGHTEE
jgi:hypothetical protein